MPTIKNISELKAILQKKINAALLTDVAEMIKVTEIQHVIDDVYSRPESREYHRRYANGGIGDVDNMHERLEGDGLLAVSNDTPFNPFLNGYDDGDGTSANSGEGLDGLIEYGDGWNGIHYDWAACEATNFIENTKQELANTNKLAEALKAGLKKQGLNVK